jgi:hypothetical protein
VKLGQIARELKLRCLTPDLGDEDSVEVVGGHASDLLSDVLAYAPADGLLVTIHTHMNVVAVAVNVGLAAVVFSSGREPEEAVRNKALEEGIRLYVSQEGTFDVSGRLYALGLRGGRR